MIYTEMTKKAMKIAYHAHDGQTDKDGVPYIFHPFHLAEQMQTEEAVITALLHDVLEDSSISISWLREQGFSEPVLEALTLLTHKHEVPYMDYIRILSTNRLAYLIKLADLRHNSDSARLKSMSESEKIRLKKKYSEAITFLEQLKP